MRRDVTAPWHKSLETSVPLESLPPTLSNDATEADFRTRQAARIRDLVEASNQWLLEQLSLLLATNEWEHLREASDMSFHGEVAREFSGKNVQDRPDSSHNAVHLILAGDVCDETPCAAGGGGGNTDWSNNAISTNCLVTASPPTGCNGAFNESPQNSLDVSVIGRDRVCKEEHEHVVDNAPSAKVCKEECEHVVDNAPSAKTNRCSVTSVDEMVGQYMMVKSHTLEPRDERQVMRSMMESLAAQLDGFEADEFNEESRRRTRGTLWPDADILKSRLKEALRRLPTDPSQRLRVRGVCQRIARSNAFEGVCLFLAAANALWLAVETDNNPEMVQSGSEMAFILVNNVFCLLFSVEVFVRIWALRDKWSCLQDRWLMFDTCMTMLMILETWVLSIVLAVAFGAGPVTSQIHHTTWIEAIRVIRLVRVARLARVMRAIPEMVVLLQGIWLSLRSVISTLVFLALISFMGALALTQLGQGSRIGEEKFSAVSMSMNTLLISLCFPDIDILLEDLRSQDVVMWAIFVTFCLFGSFASLNMLIGVLCEAVSALAAAHKEEATITYFRDGVSELWSRFSGSSSEELSVEEFARFLLQPYVLQFMANVDVDVSALVEHSHNLFKSNMCFDHTDVIALMLDFRGTNPCTVKDVVNLRKWIGGEFGDLFKSLQELRFIFAQAVKAETVEEPVLASGSARPAVYGNYGFRGETALDLSCNPRPAVRR
eukprot:TRINITY_DN9967_c1_g1_i6.p1 TRINITY_DN9967_c1_g1~~TRINITY_DN9967_c1_g1_i6.p1  ORF type:complete len:717 (-),score=106.34 TRINITY_DN9967_c1_g1_i6:141-2291(-)